MATGISRRSNGKILIVEERYIAWAMGETPPQKSITELTLATVSQFAEKHPEFPVGGIRWSIFNEDTNGLADSGAIVRVQNSRNRAAAA